MTELDAKQVLQICKINWPQSFQKLNAEEMRAMLDLWTEMFKDDSATLVKAAVKTIIAAGNREFAPNVGAIKEQMRKLTAGAEEMTEAEAWAKIRKAISNGYYGAEQEFEKLPPLCKTVVGSPQQLREWSTMDSETVHSVVSSNVQRAYKTIQQRERESAKVPEDIKARFSEAFAFRLDAPTENEPKTTLLEAHSEPEESQKLTSPALRLRALANELRGFDKPTEEQLISAEKKKKAAIQAFAAAMEGR